MKSAGAFSKALWLTSPCLDCANVLTWPNQYVIDLQTLIRDMRKMKEDLPTQGGGSELAGGRDQEYNRLLEKVFLFLSILILCKTSNT